MQITGRLKDIEVNGLIAYINKLPLRSDTSSYACNRKILWIDKELPLYLKYKIKNNLIEAYKDSNLIELEYIPLVRVYSYFLF